MKLTFKLLRTTEPKTRWFNYHHPEGATEPNYNFASSPKRARILDENELAEALKFIEERKLAGDYHFTGIEFVEVAVTLQDHLPILETRFLDMLATTELQHGIRIPRLTQLLLFIGDESATVLEVLKIKKTDLLKMRSLGKRSHAKLAEVFSKNEINVSDYPLGQDQR